MDPRPPVDTTSAGTRDVADGTDASSADRTTTTTESVREQGYDVAAAAAGQATEMAKQAGEQARHVADEARSQLRTLSGQARDQLRTQVGAQTQRASQSVRKWGDQLQALGEGRIEEAGTIREYTREAASRLFRLADRLDERGFNGVVSDVQAFARRRPAAFVAACAVVGFAASRIAKSAQTESWEIDTRDQEAARSPRGASAPPAVPPSPDVEMSGTTAPHAAPDTAPIVVLEDEPQGEIGTSRRP